MNCPTITKEIQKQYEQRKETQRGLPQICGFWGRACRQMGKAEGANRVPCIRCPLALFATNQRGD